MYRYSIIIPYHNSAALLAHALSSVPERADVQLVVVPDNNGQGAGWARNEGLRQAQGEWLLFLDDDDCYTTEAFAAFDRYTQSIGGEASIADKQEIDLIYFRLCSTFADSGEPANRHLHLNRLVDAYLSNPCTDTENDLRYRFHEPSAKLVRHSMVKEHNLCFEQVRWANDVHFSTMIGHYARHIAADSATVYNLRVERGSLVMQQTLKARRCRYEVTLRHNRQLREWGMDRYQSSLLYSLRLALRLGGVKALREFIQIGKQYDAQFFTGWQHWLKNAFNHEEKKLRQYTTN